MQKWSYNWQTGSVLITDGRVEPLAQLEAIKLFELVHVFREIFFKGKKLDENCFYLYINTDLRHTWKYVHECSEIFDRRLLVTRAS